MFQLIHSLLHSITVCAEAFNPDEDDDEDMEPRVRPLAVMSVNVE